MIFAYKQNLAFSFSPGCLGGIGGAAPFALHSSSRKTVSMPRSYLRDFLLYTFSFAQARVLGLLRAKPFGELVALRGVPRTTRASVASGLRGALNSIVSTFDSSARGDGRGSLLADFFGGISPNKTADDFANVRKSCYKLGMFLTSPVTLTLTGV